MRLFYEHTGHGNFTVYRCEFIPNATGCTLHEVAKIAKCPGGWGCNVREAIESVSCYGPPDLIHLMFALERYFNRESPQDGGYLPVQRNKEVES